MYQAYSAAITAAGRYGDARNPAQIILASFLLFVSLCFPDPDLTDH
jgi:hypothetical protein